MSHLRALVLRLSSIGYSNVFLRSYNCSNIDNLPILHRLFPCNSFQLLRLSHKSSVSVNNTRSNIFYNDSTSHHFLEKFRKNYEVLKSVSPQKTCELSSIIDAFQKTESAVVTINQTEELLQDKSTDQELHSIAVEELQAAKDGFEEHFNLLLSLLVEHNSTVPSVGREVILELSAGVGGAEAMLFCQELWNMYQLCVNRSGWQFVPQEYSESELGGLRSGQAIISPGGQRDAYSVLQHEAGIHRVQRVPKTERSGRIHTSTVAVVVMLQPNEFDVVIHGKDLKIDTFRSRGAGGQSVNKTDSAVRITHLPTGTVVECQRERNQYRNKSLALARLRSLLYQREKDKEIDASTASRRLQVGTRGRSEKIRTYNYPQDRVTDHRIGLSIHDVNGVLSGGEVFQHLLDELKEFAHRENLQTLLMSDPLANIIASVNKK